MITNLKRRASTPQEGGRLFEKLWASILGVKPQTGSGNKWFAKLDVNNRSMLWTLKYTQKKSFSISGLLIREAIQAIHGPGGIGGGTIPAAGIAIEGEEPLVILRASDFFRLAEADDHSGWAFNLPAPKAEQKRRRAKMPSLRASEDD